MDGLPWPRRFWTGATWSPFSRLWLAVSLAAEIKDKETKAKARQETKEVTLTCFKRGLMVLPCGPNSIRFSPPLTITEAGAEADTAFAIFADALAEVETRSL